MLLRKGENKNSRFRSNSLDVTFKLLVNKCKNWTRGRFRDYRSFSSVRDFTVEDKDSKGIYISGKYS